MHNVSKKHDCERFIKYKHTINGASWDEKRGKWNIQVKNGEGGVIWDEADVFINAGGVLKYVYTQSFFGLC